MFYGWVIAAAGTFGILSSIPGQTIGVSVFTDPLLEATGLGRLELSHAYLVGTVLSGLALPLGGRWLDRVGSRKLVVVASAGLGATLVFMTAVDRIAAVLAGRPDPPAWIALPVLVVGFTGLRFFGQGLLGLSSRAMVAKWFDRRPGVVSSVTSIFVNFGFASAPLLLSVGVSAVGWRSAWLVLGAAVAVGTGGIGWLLFRDNPEECGLRMDGQGGAGETAETVDRARPRDWTRAEAVRTAAFWSVTLAVAYQALIGTALTFHIVDLGAQAGLSREESVSLFLPIAFVSVATGLLVGWAIDRFSIPRVLLAMLAGQVVTSFGMAQVGEPAWRWAAVAGWGLAAGFFGPLTVAALPRFFGRRHLGAISGLQTMVMVLASAAGPSLLAAFEASGGGYARGLRLCAALPVAVAVLAWWARDPQRASD
ncbi:MAG: MFS transporter [Proteobacteria bacterium]|nr:MFS transporter [Pseudomonadota bacterium]